MKFFCDSCSTKYSISDEKVRGKILKVRCKNCGHVITVREQRLPAESAADEPRPPGAKPPRPPAPPGTQRFDPGDVEWHYAINGQSFGPFELEELREQYRSGELGDETYVWTESFSTWKPVSEVEWFQDALRASQQKSPRKNTIGVSGALEAIKPEDVEKFQSEQSDEKASHTQKQRAVDGDREAAQQDRLHALRARLKTGDSKPSDSETSDSETSEPPANEVSDEFDGGAPTVVGTSADDAAGNDWLSEPDADEASDGDGEASDLFSGFDEAPETVPADVDEAEESGKMPFSPRAPELESDSKERRDTGKQEGITGSLLIQLDEIQKEGRGGRVLLIAAAVLLVAGVTGVGFYLHSQNTEKAKEVAENARLDEDTDGEEDEVTVKTYSDDQQKKILTLGSQTVTEDDGDGDGASDGEAGAENDSNEDAPKQIAKAEPRKKESGLRLRGGNLAESDSSADDAFKGATKSKRTDDGFRQGIDEGSSMGAALDSPITDGSSFESMGGIKSDRSDPIYNPTDSVQKEKAAGPRLTSDEISKGFRNVRRSIAVCRERHGRRGGPLDARKIYLTLEIKPTGRVQGYELEPSKVQNTVFDRCLSSHKGRWSFPSFGGTSTQKVRAPIVLD